MKKKLFATVLAVILIMGLSACGKSLSPTDTVDTFLKAIKSEDSDSIKSTYSGEDLSLYDEISNSENEDEFTKLINDNLIPKLKDFDYKLENEKIDGEKATVDIAFTTYNTGEAMNSFIEDYMSQGFSLAMSGASETKLEELAATVFEENFKNLEKNYTQTVTVTLTEKDGKWMIDELAKTSDFYNAICGGILDATNDIADTFNMK